MSEIRQDPTTHEWVIFSSERRKRPSDFTAQKSSRENATFVKSCPFCPGNEDKTGLSVLYHPTPDGTTWQVRAFANKYPAVVPVGKATQKTEHHLFRTVAGTGYHEVIVESPLHNLAMPRMKVSEFVAVLKAYREIYAELACKPGIKSIVIFKNYGIAAGSSLEHPHSQAIATSVIPWNAMMKYEIAANYFKANGHSLYAEVRDREIEAADRIIVETGHFVAFHPFASQRTFETWIMPKAGPARFEQIQPIDVTRLASVMRTVLLKLYRGLDDPDFNLVVDSAPAGAEYGQCYQWHIKIIPRITKAAGFELGSGIFINGALPEQTAAFLREVKV